MRARRMILSTAVMFAVGCDRPPTAAPSTAAELESYCAIAHRADLDSWVGDVVTLCEQTVNGEGEIDLACSAARVSASGETSPIDLGWAGGVRRVLPASGGRLVVLTGDDRLVLTNADGSMNHELAAWASDPWISEGGARVAWIGLPDGSAGWDFGVPTVVAVQDLGATSRTIVAEDELAGAPRPIPGSEDVLFVSTQTGLASLWIAGPDRAASQLTNLGLTDIGQASVPAPDREITWSSGALFYASEQRIFRFSLSEGTREVGPGSWPRARTDDSVLALQGSGDGCAAIYPAGGQP